MQVLLARLRQDHCDALVDPLEPSGNVLVVANGHGRGGGKALRQDARSAQFRLQLQWAVPEARLTEVVDANYIWQMHQVLVEHGTRAAYVSNTLCMSRRTMDFAIPDKVERRSHRQICEFFEGGLSPIVGLLE